MKNYIIPHDFHGKGIDQLSGDTVIAGRLIPKGYCNATQMCKANGKKWNDYIRTKRSKSYLVALSKDTGFSIFVEKAEAGIPASALIIEILGGGDGFGAKQQGTWIHHEIAISLASWISPEFEVWANRTLRAVISGDFKPLTKEAQEAQAKLQEAWEQIRAAGKQARRRLTDAIRDWYDRNPNSTTCPAHAMYARTTDAIYLRLWGMNAKTLEAILKCKRHESRNHLDADCLRLLERAEDNAMDFIDGDNIKPVDAVSLANIRAASVKLK